MGTMNRSVIATGLAFAIHMMQGGVAASPKEAFVNSQIGERLMFGLSNHYRQFGGSPSRCNAAALKRAKRTRRNIAARASKRT